GRSNDITRTKSPSFNSSYAFTFPLKTVASVKCTSSTDESPQKPVDTLSTVKLASAFSVTTPSMIPKKNELDWISKATATRQTNISLNIKRDCFGCLEAFHSKYASTV